MILISRSSFLAARPPPYRAPLHSAGTSCAKPLIVFRPHHVLRPAAPPSVRYPLHLDDHAAISIGRRQTPSPLCKRAPECCGCAQALRLLQALFFSHFTSPSRPWRLRHGFDGSCAVVSLKHFGASAAVPGGDKTRIDLSLTSLSQGSSKTVA